MAERYHHHVSDTDIETLKKKLDLATFPDEVQDGKEWQFGVPLARIRQLTEYWNNEFDIKKAFSKLNELPQYSTTISLDRIGKLKVHFVHQVNTNPASIPLLFCHGCTFMSRLQLIIVADVALSRAGIFHRSF